MLRQRGLLVSNEDAALKQLASISYFRLASYRKVFETDEATHWFRQIDTILAAWGILHSSLFTLHSEGFGAAWEVPL